MQLSVELNFGERTVYFLIGDRSDTFRKKESEAFPQSGSECHGKQLHKSRNTVHYSISFREGEPTRRLIIG